MSGVCIRQYRPIGLWMQETTKDLIEQVLTHYFVETQPLAAAVASMSGTRSPPRDHIPYNAELCSGPF